MYIPLFVAVVVLSVVVTTDVEDVVNKVCVVVVVVVVVDVTSIGVVFCAVFVFFTKIHAHTTVAVTIKTTIVIIHMFRMTFPVRSFTHLKHGVCFLLNYIFSLSIRCS